MKLAIVAHSAITPKAIYQNGDLFLTNEEKQPFAPYLKLAYQKLELAYPKFFKMDELSKLAFMATEVMLQGVEGIEGWDGSRVAIILGNKTSSLATDQKHFDTIKDREQYFPSPAIFVYTLPNIMLGEICIRHKITGENSCFLMDDLDGDFLYPYIHELFENEKYEFCITGWVDFQSEYYRANLFLVKKFQENKNQLIFDQNMGKLIAG